MKDDATIRSQLRTCHDSFAAKLQPDCLITIKSVKKKWLTIFQLWVHKLSTVHWFAPVLLYLSHQFFHPSIIHLPPSSHPWEPDGPSCPAAMTALSLDQPWQTHTMARCEQTQKDGQASHLTLWDLNKMADILTNCSLDKMTTITQPIIWNAFLWLKSFVFW